MVDKPFQTPPIEIIHWTDTFGIDDDWYELGHKHDPRHIITCGYLVGETKNYVNLATTIDPTTETYTVAIAIYKPCITSRNTLAPKGYN